MDEEASILPKNHDLEPHPAYQPSHIHHLSETHLPSPTFFSRFLQKVSQIFQGETPVHETKLSGRIRELKTLADGLLIELHHLKAELKEKVDPELYVLVVSVLDPLIKEAGRTPPPIEKKDTTVHQVKLFSRYVESIEKGRIWVHLGKTYVVREQLEQVVIRQTAKEFLCRIDRDIQIVQEYLKNALDPFGVSEDLEAEVKEKFIPGYNSILLQLQQLKELPSDFSLNSFIAWRSHADKSREFLFGAALHAIDHFADEYLVLPKKEKENDLSEDMTGCVNSLEERIRRAADQIDGCAAPDGHQRKIWLMMIENLETETHELNTNLKLSSENSERIDGLLNVLLRLRERLF